MSDFDVLHSLSGGIDSVSVLHGLAVQNRRVLVQHLNIHSGTGQRLKSEAFAVGRVLQWLKENRGLRAASVGSDFGRVGFLYDIEIAAIAAGGCLRRYPAIQSVTLSTSRDDRLQLGWLDRHYSRLRLTEQFAGRSVDWIKPNWHKPRRQVIVELPPDLLALCSFCRMPRGPHFLPCRRCHTCRTTLPHI